MKQLLSLVALFMAIFTINAQELDQASIDQQAKEILSQLTLKEKASLCSGRDAWSTKPIDRVDLPYIWLSDGPHGLRRAPTTDTWGYGDQAPATCFPTASALSATWNLDLVKEVGVALGEECQALGVNVLLGPGVNIKRSVLGGRNFEYFTEDPYLSGKLGIAYINGVQSQGVGTSLKHFVANNVETRRMHTNSAVDPRTLHEIYLTPFEMVVKQAQPWTVMACYNRVQGTYGTESTYLLRDILKEDWGFEGIVVSDWDAVADRVQGVKARMHVQMPGPSYAYADSLIVAAVKANELDESLVDELALDIIRVVLKAKALEKKNAKQKLDEHHALGRKVAGEAITLLKNDNNTLPLSAKKYKHIAIIGEFAQNPRYQGNGSSEVKPPKVDSFMEVLKAEYGDDIKVTYARGYNLEDDNDMTFIAEAQKVASEADLAVVFTGLPLSYESEGIDRTHINIPPAHTKLLEKVFKAQPNTAVVLTNGSAIAMPWAPKAKAIVETWLGGSAGAGAVVDVLMGKVNPSGKLAETFPQKLEDTPAFLNFPGEQGEALYGERIFVGYRWYDARKIEPLFPFGHGLSYTTFEYSNLKTGSRDITDQSGLKVSLTVKNTGEIAGKEVVQLYVSDKASTLQRPVQELKAFEKVELAPGESKTVSFQLNGRDFSYYDAKRGMWIAESGEFDIRIGSSSRDIRTQATINLQSTQQVPVAFDEYTFIREFWANPETRKLLIAAIPNWLQLWTPEGKSIEQAEIMDFLADQPLKKLPILTSGEVDLDDVLEMVNESKSVVVTP